jgi:hypothetical protein
MICSGSKNVLAAKIERVDSQQTQKMERLLQVEKFICSVIQELAEAYCRLPLQELAAVKPGGLD